MPETQLAVAYFPQSLVGVVVVEGKERVERARGGGGRVSSSL